MQVVHEVCCGLDVHKKVERPVCFARLNPEGLGRRLTKRLQGLGFKVTVEP